MKQLLAVAESAAETADAEARALWPVDALVIVRNQRFGYEPTEFLASVVGASISVTMHGRRAHAYVIVNVRNIKTGKSSARYPGIDVAGLPSVRLADPGAETPVEPRFCRTCGCTDSRACPGGCWWVEPDLCSACARKAGGARG